MFRALGFRANGIEAIGFQLLGFYCNSALNPKPKKTLKPKTHNSTLSYNPLHYPKT